MTSKNGRPYASPSAFRMALTEKLRNLAATEGRWPLRDLQRQFAYDRLLTRLYLLDDGWVLKGSTALLARRIAVRHTIDVDVYRAASLEQAERDLRAALLIDGGDWFSFEAAPGRSIVEDMRHHGNAGAPQRPSTRFKDLVDLVVLTNQARPTAAAQQTALLSETHRRGLDLPERFDVPDHAMWEKGYPAEAGRSLLPAARTLHEALQHVRQFVDPLLQGRATGIWDPDIRQWL